MHRWYRVFTPDETCPPEDVLPGAVFGREGAEWFWAEADGVRVERFLADEEGIRAELNTWAAVVEATSGDATLMERIIQSRQLFTVGGPAEAAEAVAEALARATGGISLAGPEEDE